MIPQQVRFRCSVCSRGEVSTMLARPLCHDLGMDVLGPLFPPRTDPDAISVALLDLKTETPPAECADWHERREVWFLRPGRQDGERIGWIGKSMLSWRYLMPMGIRDSHRRGVAITKQRAVVAILAELDR